MSADTYKLAHNQSDIRTTHLIFLFQHTKRRSKTMIRKNSVLYASSIEIRYDIVPFKCTDKYKCSASDNYGQKLHLS